MRSRPWNLDSKVQSGIRIRKLESISVYLKVSPNAEKKGVHPVFSKRVRGRVLAHQPPKRKGGRPVFSKGGIRARIGSPAAEKQKCEHPVFSKGVQGRVLARQPPKNKNASIQFSQKGVRGRVLARQPPKRKGEHPVFSKRVRGRVLARQPPMKGCRDEGVRGN